MSQNRYHPWHQAATYIRAAFAEETNPEAVRAIEQAARLLDQAVDDEPTDRGTTSMEYIQDPIFEGNVTVRCTAEEWLARQEQEEKEAKQRYQNDPQAAVTKLYNIAITNTGGGRAASALLLSLWNDHFVANLRDVISALDIDNTAAALALLTTLGPGHHLERYLTDEQIGQIIEVWGGQHERKRA